MYYLKSVVYGSAASSAAVVLSESRFGGTSRRRQHEKQGIGARGAEAASFRKMPPSQGEAFVILTLLQ